MTSKEQHEARAASSPFDDGAPQTGAAGAGTMGKSWREFAVEIAIVVIGVLLALGAQQVADAWRWRQDIQGGEAALREDARDLVDAAAQREAQSPCLAARFAAIAAVLDRAGATDTLPAVGQLGAPSLRLWSLKSWDSLIASQVATHMPRERMLRYSALAAIARRAQEQNTEEFRAWTDLYTIVGPGRALLPAEQAGVRTALSRAVLSAKAQLFTAQSLPNMIVDSGLLPTSEVRAIRRAAAADYRVDARDGIMCKPLSAAPPAAAYGQAPSPVDLTARFDPETWRAH